MTEWRQRKGNQSRMGCEFPADHPKPWMFDDLVETIKLTNPKDHMNDAVHGSFSVAINGSAPSARSTPPGGWIANCALFSLSFSQDSTKHKVICEATIELGGAAADKTCVFRDSELLS